jgi:DNA-binding CsgD family transcriptional regulator
MNGILALVPTAQRLEVAAMLLKDEVRRLNDRSIAPASAPLSAADRRVWAMSEVVRATNELRGRFAQIPHTQNIDGVSMRFHFSKRQREVVDLLLFGLSEKAVAIQLGLSRHTVHVYVKDIYRILAVQSRAEMMSRCLFEVFGLVPSNRKLRRRVLDGATGSSPRAIEAAAPSC